MMRYRCIPPALLFLGCATALGDVSVNSTLAPRNGAGFPVVRDTDVGGGYSSVADTTTRDAIPTGKRKTGMQVLVTGQGIHYTYGPGGNFTPSSGDILVTQWDARGDDVHDDTAAIQSACTFAVTYGNAQSPATLFFPAGNFTNAYRVTNNIAVPNGVILKFAPGASLDIASGKTVSINTPHGVEAGLWQIVRGAGSLTFVNDASPIHVYPEWWGATKSGADVGPALNKMCLALNRSKVLLTGYYNFSTAVTCNSSNLDIEGTDAFATGLIWTGGSSVAFDMAGLNAPTLRNFSFNNSGTATTLLRMHGQAIHLHRILVGNRSNHVGTSGAAILVDPAYVSYDVVLDGVKVYSQTAGSENAYGFWAAGSANTVVLRNCFFTGNKVGARIGDHTGGNNGVDGFVSDGSRYEAFSGTGASHPGGPNAVGLWLDRTNGPTVIGGSFEMVGDQSADGATNRGIECWQSYGGVVSGVNLNGDGAATAMINIADATCIGLRIDANNFYRVSGYAVEKTGTGSFNNIAWGVNTRYSGVTGIFNGSPPTPPAVNTGFSY